MNEGDQAALEGVCGPVSRETFFLLKDLESEIKRWNSRINLVSAGSLGDFWFRHIVDCAQLAVLKPAYSRWLDLGSGGGLPGLVTAIMVRERPGARVTLVESNRKKSTFLTSFAGKHQLPATILSCRIEEARENGEEYEAVTARALAELPLLLELASPWLLAGVNGLFQKGRDYRSEIAKSTAAWQFDLVEHASKTDPQGAILEISGLGHRQEA